MHLEVVHEILKQAHLKAAFQAFLLTATENGHTVAELAAQLGVPKRTLYRWIAKARSRKPSKGPRAELIYRPNAAQGEPCNHSGAFFMGPRRICLECMASNFERDPLFRPSPDDPKPDKVPCVPKPLKGGTGKSTAGAA